MCSTCLIFDLCFKCYRSRDTIHPDHPFDDFGREYESKSEKSLELNDDLANDGDDERMFHSEVNDEEENESEKESEEDESDSKLNEDRNVDYNINEGKNNEATTR